MYFFLNQSLFNALNNSTYVRTIKLQYAYLSKPKKQILSKFKWQVMRALNMKEEDTQEQTQPVFDLYSNSLKDVIDTNIDDGLSVKNNYLRLLKPSAQALQPGKAVLLLSGLLGNGSWAISSKRNNSKPLPRGNSSPRLPLSIVPQDLLNPLFKSNNRRLQKTKKSVKLASEGMADSSNSARQFASTLSQSSSAISENNAEGIGNSRGKLTQENL